MASATACEIREPSPPQAAPGYGVNTQWLSDLVAGYRIGMNILLLLVVLLLLFGGGGFYYGGPVYGGSGLGLILLICLVVYLAGGFRTRKG